MFDRLRSVFRAISGRRHFEDGMTEELRFHIEQYTEDLVRSGVSKDEATRRARLEFGSLDGVKIDCREARGLSIIDEFQRNVRFALRLLRKSPGFTATALLTLGLCLGANLTIFAVLDSIVVRQLPFPDANRLVTIYNTYPKAGVDRDGSSITNYYERRGHIPALTGIALYNPGTAIAGDTGATERVPVLRVTPGFFATLGVFPTRGREFTEAEMEYKNDQVTILTDSYWREHLNGDLGIVGKQIRVEGLPITVVGILPPGFRFLSSTAKLYFPLLSNAAARMPGERHSGGNSRHMIARLSAGATITEAQAQIDTQNATLEVDDPAAKMMADAGFRSVVTGLRDDHVASVRPVLLLLQAGVFTLLLIGTVNLVNLLLIRANGRSKELAVRKALGAGRRQVLNDIVAETSLLAVFGGLLGLGLGAAGVRLVSWLGADRLPLGGEIVFNARLAWAGLFGTLVLALVLAAPVGWFHLRFHLADALQAEGRGGTSSRSAQRLRHGFVVVQIALAFVMLSGAGLLSLSLQQAMAIAPGFRADHLLTGQISLPRKSYPSVAALLSFTERLSAELRGQPGVVSAAVVTNMPLSGHNGKSAATVKGYARRPGEAPRGHYSYSVGGNYFETLGLPLRQGRFLTDDDNHRAERLCVVDEDFARYYWPQQNPIGQQLFEGGSAGKEADVFTVVGVVGSVKQAGPEDEAQGAVYYPLAFRADNRLYVALRTNLEPEALSVVLQRVVREMDRDLPVTDVRSMQTRVSDSLVARRSPAMLAAAFSAIALLLTAIGVYGVLSYSVSQRRREIGVRMALGARPAQIRSQFLGIALRLLAVGTVAGIGAAWCTGRAMQSVLFHVPAFHAGTVAAVTVVLVAVALIAGLVPSSRASRVSPREALGGQ